MNIFEMAILSFITQKYGIILANFCKSRNVGICYG